MATHLLRLDGTLRCNRRQRLAYPRVVRGHQEPTCRRCRRAWAHLRFARLLVARFPLALLLASLALAGCYGRVEAPRIWVMPNALFGPDAALAACQVWARDGIECSLADGPGDANVPVYAYRDPALCGRALAEAWEQDNSITVNEACFDRVGQYDVRIVLAHELAHLMGAWEHVPAEPDARTWCGQPASGPGLLNLEYRPGLEPATSLPDRIEFMRQRGDFNCDDADRVAAEMQVTL